MIGGARKVTSGGEFLEELVWNAFQEPIQALPISDVNVLYHALDQCVCKYVLVHDIVHVCLCVCMCVSLYSTCQINSSFLR